ncbi:MAG: (2Fe-2S)-binding protein [Perlabentimonas sp.]
MAKADKYICECKAVFPSEVAIAIKKKNARTLFDIQNLTKASTGCGRCKTQLLMLIESEIKRNDKAGKQLKINF